MSLHNLALAAKAKTTTVSVPATTTEPLSTAPQNAASLALVAVNPYAYRAALTHHEVLNFVFVAFALAAIGFALIFRIVIERAVTPSLERLRSVVRLTPRA